jgi:hypothetical protein
LKLRKTIFLIIFFTIRDLSVLVVSPAPGQYHRGSNFEQVGGGGNRTIKRNADCINKILKNKNYTLWTISIN